MYCWVVGMAQVVESLPIKHNVLSSNPSTTRKKSKAKCQDGGVAQVVEHLPTKARP
jgi:hypothetical protein